MAPRSGPVPGAPLLQPARRMRFDTLPPGTSGQPHQPVAHHWPTEAQYRRRAALFPDHFPYQRPVQGGRPDHGGRTNHVLDLKLFNYLPRDEDLVAFVNVALPQLHPIAELEHTLQQPQLPLFQAYRASTDLYNRYAAIAQALHRYYHGATETLWALQAQADGASDSDADDPFCEPSGPVAEVGAKYRALYDAVLARHEAAVQAEQRWLQSGGRT